jgi:hypothetical protein
MRRQGPPRSELRPPTTARLSRGCRQGFAHRADDLVLGREPVVAVLACDHAIVHPHRELASISDDELGLEAQRLTD